MQGTETGLGWGGIFRLGLVQTALGAMVVLATSTFNRVMVVELALPAMLPGVLVGLHYITQLFRPRMGHGSDVGGRSTPWIIGGMLVLGVGTLGAAASTTLLESKTVSAFALAAIAYVLIGLGVGAAGTNLLVLLAKRVAENRRGAAASVVWMMMIAGFAVTATTAGRYLDPYSGARLVAVTASVVGIALVIMLIALHGLERGAGSTRTAPDEARAKFSEALRQVWAEAEARQFTIFVFISMLAYSAQDLILEPFAGTVFGFSVGESTSLSGLQHQGVFAGMIAVAVVTSVASRTWLGSLKLWTVAGCLGSAVTLGLLSMASLKAPSWPLAATVFALGFANGAFAVAAIGSMMANAGHGTHAREGVRMGLWGAAQASAFGIGGFAGTVMSDVAHALLGSPVQAYAVVFGLEGALFLVSAILAAQLHVHRTSRASATRGPVFT